MRDKVTYLCPYLHKKHEIEEFIHKYFSKVPSYCFVLEQLLGPYKKFKPKTSFLAMLKNR